jgi:hypothetical protein
MERETGPNRALFTAAAVGTLLQLAMVVTGHFVPAIAQLFGPLGMGISLVAGWLYVRLAGSQPRGKAVWRAMLVGGICAFLGIVVSFLLGDVTAVILAFGTLSSAVTGALGGFLGHLLRSRRAVQA